MTATLDAMKAVQTYAIDTMHSEVAFQVRHLLTKVRGRSRISQERWCSTSHRALGDTPSLVSGSFLGRVPTNG